MDYLAGAPPPPMLPYGMHQHQPTFGFSPFTPVFAPGTALTTTSTANFQQLPAPQFMRSDLFYASLNPVFTFPPLPMMSPFMPPPIPFSQPCEMLDATRQQQFLDERPNVVLLGLTQQQHAAPVSDTTLSPNPSTAMHNSKTRARGRPQSSNIKRATKKGTPPSFHDPIAVFSQDQVEHEILAHLSMLAATKQHVRSLQDEDSAPEPLPLAINVHEIAECFRGSKHNLERLRRIAPPEYRNSLEKLRRTLLGSASKRERRSRGWPAEVCGASAFVFTCTID